jgi:hypothetical protein
MIAFLKIANCRAIILPLPAGEDRGEGESFERKSLPLHVKGELHTNLVGRASPRAVTPQKLLNLARIPHHNYFRRARSRLVTLSHAQSRSFQKKKIGYFFPEWLANIGYR